MRYLAPLAAFALLLPACSTESPVASLARATLIPGTALGPVELGKTTLAELVNTYGPGRGALLAGDDFCGIEVQYESQQLAFLFELDAKEAYALSNPSIMHAARELDDFLAAHPQVGTTRLHSLSVQAKKRSIDSFYHGSIDGRAKLFADLQAFFGYMENPAPEAPDFVAGGQEGLPEQRWTCYQNGISVYLLTPEEGGQPYVERITIFQPRSAS